MISARSRWRWGLYGAVWPSLVVGAGGAVVLAANGPMSLGWPLLVVAALVLVGGLATSRLAHRRWRWDIDGSALRTRHGVLIDRHTDVELRKIQSVEVRRSWWQRRNGLATITFRTAGGSVAIPHLDGETAASMRDGVLAIVERTKGPWM
ncbi:MAG: PH domain-containing protein [Acidimicrobiales bacterium]